MRKMAKPKTARRNAAVAALLGVTALAVAGCGGGSKSSAPPTAPSVTVTVATAPPVATTTPAATVASTTETTTGGTGTAGTGSLKGCTDLVGFGQAMSKALGASAGSGASGIGAQADAFKAFTSHAPAEIRPQFKIIADAIAKYAEVLKGVNLKPGQVPSADVIAKLQVAAKEINQPAVAAAGQKISTWVQAHCHA